MHYLRTVRERNFRPRGEFEFRGKNYILSTPDPYYIMEDNNLTWESKGYLSCFLTTNIQFEFSDASFSNLIECGYVKEKTTQNEEDKNG